MILSLVRSNDRAAIGFLNDPNRVNVAISRAKKLLVIVGDSKTVIGGAPELFGPLFEHASNTRTERVEGKKKKKKTYCWYGGSPTPDRIMTREAFENAIVVNSAIGGSTNCPPHVTAIARHIGVDLDCERLGNHWTRDSIAGQRATGR